MVTSRKSITSAQRNVIRNAPKRPSASRKASTPAKKPAAGGYKKQSGDLSDLWIITTPQGFVVSPKYYTNPKAAIDVKEAELDMAEDDIVAYRQINEWRILTIEKYIHEMGYLP